MARDTSKLVTIPGELHSAATGNIVSASQEIFDYDSSSYQSQLNKQVYNVSAHDSSADAKYTLDEAIAAVPTSYHVGGLILTFVSKEGDFEMYQLKSKDWTDDTEKWGIIKTAIVNDNPEFIEVHLDDSDKVLYGVQKDGNFYFGGGVPSQVKNYVDEKIDETDAKIDELARIVDSSISTAIDQIENDIDRLDASVNTGFARVDASMNQMESHFDASINALDASIHNLGYYDENPEYAEVHLDASSKVLYGVQKDGNFYFGGGVPSQVKAEIDKLENEIDSSINAAIERLDSSIKTDIASINSNIANIDSSIERIDSDIKDLDASIYNLGYYEENPEFVEAHIDSSVKLLYGVKKDGDFYFGGGVPSQVVDFIEDTKSEIDASILDSDASIFDIKTRFYNVNEHDGSVGINYTLEEAIAAVPEDYRRGGLILTFNSNGLFKNYQDASTNWSEDPKDWIQYSSEFDIHPEFINIEIDSSNHILSSRNKDGVKKEYVGFETPYVDTEKIGLNGNYITSSENQEFIEVKVDSSNHIVESITNDGVKHINIPIDTPAYDQYYTDNPEYVKVETDLDNKIINAIKRNGDIIIGGVNINELKRLIDSNIISIEYDASTYEIYAITGEDSNVSLSMDEEGHIYKETIID